MFALYEYDRLIFEKNSKNEFLVKIGHRPFFDTGATMRQVLTLKMIRIKRPRLTLHKTYSTSN